MGHYPPDCAVSSVVEHYLDTVGVTGSNPVSRIVLECGGSDAAFQKELRVLHNPLQSSEPEFLRQRLNRDHR